MICNEENRFLLRNFGDFDMPFVAAFFIRLRLYSDKRILFIWFFLPSAVISMRSNCVVVGDELLLSFLLYGWWKFSVIKYYFWFICIIRRNINQSDQLHKYTKIECSVIYFGFDLLDCLSNWICGFCFVWFLTIKWGARCWSWNACKRIVYSNTI